MEVYRGNDEEETRYGSRSDDRNTKKRLLHIQKNCVAEHYRKVQLTPSSRVQSHAISAVVFPIRSFSGVSSHDIRLHLWLFLYFGSRTEFSLSTFSDLVLLLFVLVSPSCNFL